MLSLIRPSLLLLLSFLLPSIAFDGDSRYMSEWVAALFRCFCQERFHSPLWLCIHIFYFSLMSSNLCPIHCAPSHTTYLLAIVNSCLCSPWFYKNSFLIIILISFLLCHHDCCQCCCAWWKCLLADRKNSHCENWIITKWEIEAQLNSLVFL